MHSVVEGSISLDTASISWLYSVESIFTPTHMHILQMPL